MQRYNTFLLIHKGLRAMMYDVSLSLQHADFANAHEYPHSLERLELVLEMFDAHAGHEDKHIFTLLEACDPALQEEMEKEHVTDHALSDGLRTLIAAYKAATDAAEKGAIGSKINYTFNEFIAFNLSHMNKEEIVVNASFWKHYTDADIMQANFRMVASLAPDEVKRNAIWMMRGCSDPELIGWIGAIKKQAPPPVAELLMGIARQELPSHRYEKIESAVMQTA